jgi:hypothetical protein
MTTQPPPSQPQQMPPPLPPPLPYHRPAPPAHVLAGGRVVLQRGYFAHFPKIWWQSLMAWGPVVIGIAIWVEVLTGRAPPQRDPVAATLGVLASIAMLVVYVRFFFGHETYELFDEGIRLEQHRFTEWHAFHHYAERDGDLVLYHKGSPALPAAVLPTDKVDPDLLVELRWLLRAYGVPRDDAVDPRYYVVGAYTILGTIATLALGAYLLRTTRIDRLVLFLVVFWFGMGGVMLLEWYRGIYRTTKVKPRTSENKILNPFTGRARIADALRVERSHAARYGPIPPPPVELLPRRRFALATYPRGADPTIAAASARHWADLTGPMPWDVVTIPSDAGGDRRVLPVFVTADAAMAWMAYGGPPLSVHGSEICRRVIAGAADVIVIEPTHPEAHEIPAETIRAMVPL